MSQTWPFLGERLCFESQDLEEIDLLPGDVVVSAHACGGLTDMILTRAVDARARVAVLPCCHDLKTCDTAGLVSWMAPDLAVDVARAIKLRGAGYEIYTAAIPAAITPKTACSWGCLVCQTASNSSPSGSRADRLAKSCLSRARAVIELELKIFR